MLSRDCVLAQQEWQTESTQWIKIGSEGVIAAPDGSLTCERDFEVTHGGRPVAHPASHPAWAWAHGLPETAYYAP